MLDKRLEGGKWHGGWQQEKNVDGENRLGRRDCLVGSLEDCRWQELWRQNGDVEGGSGLVRRNSLARCGRWKMAM